MLVHGLFGKIPFCNFDRICEPSSAINPVSSRHQRFFIREGMVKLIPPSDNSNPDRKPESLSDGSYCAFCSSHTGGSFYRWHPVPQ